MNNLVKLIGIIALAAVIGLSMIACSDGGGSTGGSRAADPTSVTYASTDSDGTRYELVITKAGGARAVYAPKSDDTYVLTITPPGNKSMGKVKSVSGNNITLEHKDGNEVIVTVSNTDNSIVSFLSDIPLDDGRSVPKPGTLNPVNPGGGNQLEITSPTGIVLRRISAGSFIMGSPVSEEDRGTIDDGYYVHDYERQRQVTLTKDFYMGKYEVTQKQYETVMGSLPISSSNARGKGDNYPIYYVSWYDAVEFCNKLSEFEGLTPFYAINKTVGSDTNNKSSEDSDPYRWLVTWNTSANGYRLPTEAQWEYACRAGTTTPWHSAATENDATNPLSDYAWYNNMFGDTKEVGQKKPNAWGLYDMHGNVAEWCWDWFMEIDDSAAQTDPSGYYYGGTRTCRGGNYFQPKAGSCRSASRMGSDFSSFKGFGYGIRLVRSL
jgi:formylglycine-generating enzyme required for sulfatase activity